MLVSSDRRIDGMRIVKEIGQISAVSGWSGRADDAGSRAKALASLIAQAKDYEADAIIGVDYAVDGVTSCDLAALPLKRVAVTGIAVKIGRAA